MIKGVSYANLDQFGIIQNLQISPIPQTSFLVGTFIQQGKQALVKRDPE